MFVQSEALVPHQVYLDAKHYIEAGRIPFIDFYRNSVFGYVQVAEKRGHFVLVLARDNGELEAHCNCGEADLDEVCGHAFALYLRLQNWPHEVAFLSDAFEAYPLCRFCKTAGRAIGKKTLTPETNPALILDEIKGNLRFLNYLEFGPDCDGRLAKRDRKVMDRARERIRTPQEVAMLRKNFPSARIIFEESILYRLCKLFFFMDRAAALDIRIRQLEDHQVQLQLTSEDELVFSWKLGVNAWLKGIKDDWDYWTERADFQVQQQGQPIVWRIQFNGSNDLEIEPHIALAEDHYKPLADVIIPKLNNLYHVPELGYFRVQTGLSDFEMSHSNPQITTIKQDAVKAFLAKYRDTLQTLDRNLMDEALFGEIVVEHFDAFTLHLLDYDSETSRFTYSLEAAMDHAAVHLIELRTLFSEGGRYRKLGGRLFDLTGYDAVFLKEILRESQTQTGELDMGVRDLFRLIAWFKERIKVKTNNLTESIYTDLKNFKLPESPSLAHTKLQLRDYQTLGYEWLYFLYHFGLGGLLCDQMGLGKTHQGMALLAGAAAEKPNFRGLVVCPASVMYHWQDKLKRFCPNIATTVYHGTDRNADKALLHHHVLITTYGTLRNDVDKLSTRVLDLVIFDEIQNLKNKKTKAYAAIAQLAVRARVGLTGTPIENALDDLKGLFDMVFPGYMGTDRHYRRYFADPIARFNQTKAKTRLSALISPFTLRRSKNEVLTELPKKTEDVRPILMEEYQAELYREIKKQGYKEIAEAGTEGGATYIFALIDKLKQICNHPSLYLKSDDYNAFPCTKWDQFLALLNEGLAAGEKVVVFTQYLGMIRLMQRYLRDNKLEYATVTGQTRDRAGEQQRFMEDDNCRVFLGTVRASGVGIDLTSASMLIHYDRWWNAAREEQATDRVHRIGQTKSVLIYKFKTVGTVEERIDRIIEQKRALLDDVVTFDGETAAKKFTMDELLEILA